MSFTSVAQRDSTLSAYANAMLVASRPMNYGVRGHYCMATSIQLPVSTVANATLYSLRWTSAAALFVLTDLTIDCHQTAPATATIYPNFQAFIARSFTVSDSAGTAISLAGNAFKRRTSMATTLVGDMRKAAIAAGLTVGTRTLDLEPILELDTAQIITVGSATVPPGQILYIEQLRTRMDAGEHPHVLAANEGLIIRGPTTAFGLAGTAEVSVRLSWTELVAF